MSEQQPPPPGDRLDRLIETLTFKRVSLVFLAAAAYFVFEHRDTVFPAIAGSAVASIGLAAGFGLFVLGLVGNELLARMDRKGEAFEKKGADFEKFLMSELNATRAELAATRNDLAETREELLEVRRNDKRCQARLRHAEHEIQRLGGDPPDQSTWGDL